MSKVRPDPFPGYQTVRLLLWRLASRRRLLGFRRRCVCSLLKETFRPLKAYINIENHTNNNAELPSYPKYNQESLWTRWSTFTF